MKVILKEDVKKVGKAGEVVEVSEGYGRNFLLPKGLAAEATAQNLNLAQQKAGAAAHKKAQEADVAEALKKAHGIELDKRKITLSPEVTGPGDYEAVIRVHPEVTSRIKVRIAAE